MIKKKKKSKAKAKKVVKNSAKRRPAKRTAAKLPNRAPLRKNRAKPQGAKRSKWPVRINAPVVTESTDWIPCTAMRFVKNPGGSVTVHVKQKRR